MDVALGRNNFTVEIFRRRGKKSGARRQDDIAGGGVASISLHEIYAKLRFFLSLALVARLPGLSTELVHLN